jgi:hypothetical protein
VAAHDADATWAIADEAGLARRAGFAPVAYFASGKARDPLGEAAAWADRLRSDGIDAAVEPGSLPRLPAVGRKARRDGAALLVGSHEWQNAFEVLFRAGGGFPLVVPPGYPDVLMGEDALVDVRDKSGSGVVVTATRAISIRSDVVRVVSIADVMGTRSDESSQFLVVRDEGGRTESWRISGLGTGDQWATLLAVAAPDLVRAIFDQVAAGIETGKVAKHLNGLSAFGRSWDRGDVRRVLASRVVEQGSSPVGIIDSGTWQQAQFALEREKARRGTWRERVRPSLPALIPLAVAAGIAFAIYGGVRDWLTPRGSTASKPYWLTQQGSIGGGWKMDVEWTSFWPSAPAPQLVVNLSLTNERLQPSSAGPLIERLRLGNTHGARHPARRCYGKTGLLSLVFPVPAASYTGGVVCFDIVVLHLASLRLVVEPRPGTSDHAVWFGLVDAPVDNSGDAGD